jgi:DNA-binding NtrC family response regulator
MPPLRERLEDIPLLVTYVLARHDPNNRIDVPEATIRKLQQSIWPGNVRQLSNVLERSLLFAENNVLHPDSIRLLGGMVHLASDSVQHTQSDVALRDEDGAFRPLEDVINDAERRALVEVLEHFHWDTKVVREELSISKSWLYKLLKKHGLARPAS